MKVSGIILARVLAFIEIYDLNAKGKMSMGDVIQGIAERYKFQRLPRREEYEKEGLIFEDGKIGNKTIKKLTFYDALIVLETRSNTTDSKQIIEEMLEWGAAKFDLSYTPDLIKHFAYVSDLTFYSDVPILSAACQPLVDIANKTGAALTEMWREPIQYYPTTLSIGHDPLTRKNGIAPFSISRRSEAKFSENKYFSEAPLPTDMHVALLGEFETGVKRILDALKRGILTQ